MSQLYETVIQFFTDDGWPFTENDEQSVVHTAFSSDNGQWRCVAQVRESQEQVVFYSSCPVNTPEEKRLNMAEFLTRANFGLIVGNFEMDFADGEVRYKTSIDLGGSQLTILLVKQIVYANVFTMDIYLPGIMSVIYSGVHPAEAVAKVEGREE